jgi:hypothetical protein
LKVALLFAWLFAIVSIVAQTIKQTKIVSYQAYQFSHSIERFNLFRDFSLLFLFNTSLHWIF